MASRQDRIIDVHPTRRQVICYTAASALAAAAPLEELWKFDGLDQLGDHTTTVLGAPNVVSTPVGKAIEFDGVQDALFVDAHPLAGAETFTWEVIFRPSADGKPEQRFFHMQEQGTQNRLLMETRLIGAQWCLDSYAHSSADSQALLNRERLYPLGAWYNITTRYDGKEFSNYINGELQGKATVRLTPQGSGRSSVGTRIDRRDYFKGAVLLARMTRRALDPGDFLKAPK